MKHPQAAASDHESELKDGCENNKEKAIAEDADGGDESIADGIDCFLGNLKGGGDQNPPQLPDSVIHKLLAMVEKDLSKHESDTGKCPPALLDAIDRVAKLSTALSAFSSSEADYKKTATRASAVLQRAMSFLEEEFRLLLEEDNNNKSNMAPVSRAGSKQTPRRQSSVDNPKTMLPADADAVADADAAARQNSPPYPPETVAKLRRIADVMISAGFVSECFQTFSIARHNAFDASLSNLGFHRVINNDEMQKMQCEALQREITTWIQAFRQSISVFFPCERDLCESVFSEHRGIAGSLFNNLTRCVLIQLLNFAEVISVTRGSAENLFKFLDMYESLRDMLPKMDALFPGTEEAVDLKTEISTTRSHIGEAAATIFCDLEGSIRADIAKNPVPGGGVHPLTRYVMNYLKYACEYGETLEQVFSESQKHANSSSEHPPLTTQLISAMDLLDSNLEVKSKLYKEPALNYIFLMNNGRYIVKKIKESNNIFKLVGDNWYRKRSSGLRQYHKNYQRETWAKVLGCFKEEGLQVKGNLSKTTLKERMKSFNVMFEEILKTQSTWVVSDEQLKSELRVSISAVLVPAYRSFLGRYRQVMSGKQAEKHVKFGPEDIETKIDELFEGNPSNHGKKR